MERSSQNADLSLIEVLWNRVMLMAILLFFTTNTEGNADVSPPLVYEPDSEPECEELGTELIVFVLSVRSQ